MLAPTLSAPAAARTFVQQVCCYRELALPDTTLVDRAVLLANELITNAAVHAQTDLRLRLELRGDLLHIAVRDGSPRLLRVVASDPHAPGGRGLWLVEQLAHAWGVSRHPDGGKVVWCTLRLYSPYSPFLGDWCQIRLDDPDGAMRHRTVAHSDPAAGAERAAQVLLFDHLTPDILGPITQDADHPSWSPPSTSGCDARTC